GSGRRTEFHAQPVWRAIDAHNIGQAYTTMKLLNMSRIEEVFEQVLERASRDQVLDGMQDPGLLRVELGPAEGLVVGCLALGMVPHHDDVIDLAGRMDRQLHRWGNHDLRVRNI